MEISGSPTKQSAIRPQIHRKEREETDYGLLSILRDQFYKKNYLRRLHYGN
jgi:hypothetical protein